MRRSRVPRGGSELELGLCVRSKGSSGLLQDLEPSLGWEQKMPTTPLFSLNMQSLHRRELIIHGSKGETLDNSRIRGGNFGQFTDQRGKLWIIHGSKGEILDNSQIKGRAPLLVL